MAAPWTDDEPGFFALRHELTRLVARARRRRRAVLYAAGAVSLAAFVFTLRAPHDYEAQITLRVTEVVEFHLPRSSWTDRELRSFVTQVAFTNEVLGQVYQRHIADFAPAPTLTRGIENLREDVEVYAVRNRIIAEDQEKTVGPRSAHLILRYAARREDRALAVLKSLAEPIMRTSTLRRRLEAVQELSRIQLTLEDAKRVHAQLRDQALARAALPMSGAGSISPVRMVALESAVKEAHMRVARIQKEKDEALRRQQIETRRPGIDFELSEQSVVRPLPLIPLLLAVTLLAFLVAVPMSAIVIGAFATTIDTIEDVRRLGVPVIGHLPAPPSPAPSPPHASALRQAPTAASPGQATTGN